MAIYDIVVITSTASSFGGGCNHVVSSAASIGSPERHRLRGGGPFHFRGDRCLGDAQREGRRPRGTTRDIHRVMGTDVHDHRLWPAAAGNPARDGQPSAGKRDPERGRPGREWPPARGGDPLLTRSTRDLLAIRPCIWGT